MAGMLTESPAARLRNIANRIEDPQDRAELVQLAKLHEPAPLPSHTWVHFAPGGRVIECRATDVGGRWTWDVRTAVRDSAPLDGVYEVHGWAGCLDSAVEQAMDWAGRMVAA